MYMCKPIIYLSLALTAGCSWMPRLEWGPEPEIIPPEPQIITVTEKVPLRIYQPPLPQEIDLLNVNFFVITEENYEEKKKEVEKILDGNFVVFALTPDGYEKMAENFQEVRRYVRQQKELIIYYREATTESEGTTAEDWLENNEPNSQTSN
jgi:plasmid stabilization system protein ParE